MGTVGRRHDDKDPSLRPRSRGCRPRRAGALAATTAACVALASCGLGDGGDGGDDSDATASEVDPPADGDLADPPAAPGPEPEPAPDPAPEPDPEPEPALGAYGVSAGDADAVAAGMEVLDAGGSAVDAAIATAFAVSVVEPFASGIGGGGAALVVTVDGEARSYDYREVVAADGRIPASNTGIPGFVQGMSELHADHGEVAWEQLLAPAISLADDGTATSSILAAQLRSAAHRLPTGQLPSLYPGGQPLSEGDPLQQPELADTLRAIAADGGDAVRHGAVGQALVDAVDGIGADSLAAYQVQVSDPPRGPFAGFEVVAAAPPLPGAALIQLLQVAESLDVAAVAPGSADHIHRLMMAWRVADGSIASVLGDPAFVEVPLAELTDVDANERLAATIDDGALLASGHLADAASDAAAGNTTHITTVDADGTVVSMTNTLTNFWGSGQQVAGFFVNDQLSRFSVGGDANAPAPGRRSVSWSLPLVVLDDASRPVLGIGSPGGRRIPTIEAGVLARWALHGASLSDAVEAGRVHLEGNVLQFEALPSDEVAADLRARGYAGLEIPDPVYYFGSVQALEIDHDARTVTGAVDPRRDGDWDSATR